MPSTSGTPDPTAHEGVRRMSDQRNQPRERFMIDPTDFACVCQSHSSPYFCRPIHGWGDAMAGCEHVSAADAYRREYERWRTDLRTLERSQEDEDVQ